MSTEKSAAETMESSRLEVMQCEKEITSIKESLRALNIEANAASGNVSVNSLKVSIHKVSSTEEGGPTSFKIHLSSPIESHDIGKVHDPLDPDAEGSFANFTSVETSNALVTIEAFVGEEKIGVSAAHDLLPLVEGMKAGGDGSKSCTVDFAIVAEDGEHVGDVDATEDNNGEDAGEKEPAADSSEAAADNVESEDTASGEETEAATGKEEEGETEKSDEPADESNDETFEDAKEEPEETADDTKPAQDASNEGVAEQKIQVPVCTLSVHLEYTPSLDYKRDELYDQLNEVSKRKAAAIESLRKSASAVNRAKMEEAEDKKSTVVKSGFLNKSKPAAVKTPPPFWKRWYDKTIGPKSMLWVVGPVAKNYVIFFGVTTFFYYKGDLLALPPPV
jgi:hypothetical protein